MLLTWNNLQSKGLIGPSYCLLCKNHDEGIPHIFIHCSFSKEVWFHCMQVLNLISQWNGNNLNECMDEWNNRPEYSKNLPLLVCWHISLDRNKILFEGKNPTARVTSHKAMGALGNVSMIEKEQNLRVNSINRINGCLVAFFLWSFRGRWHKLC